MKGRGRVLIDKEDLQEWSKEIVVPKVKDKRFKIDLSISFYICILIIALSEVMKDFESAPQLFKGGDTVFHMLESLIYIASQLAVSLAAAIIFFYVAELVDKRKNIDKFMHIMKESREVLEKHMNIVYDLNSFEKLHRDKERLKRDLKTFLPGDVPIFMNCIKDLKEGQLEDEIYDYFLDIKINSNDDYVNLDLKISFFESCLKGISEYENISFYKNFREDVHNLERLYKNFREKFDEVFKPVNFDVSNLDDSEVNSLNYNLTIMIDYYCKFLYMSVQIFSYSTRYIYSIKHKKILEFAKMLG